MTHPRASVDALSWAAFAVGFLACDFVTNTLPTPMLWYFPLAHRFEWQLHAAGVAADFYGRMLLYLLAGACAFAVARVVASRVSDAVAERWLRTLTAWILGLALFTAGLHVFTLAHRQPIAAPVPEAYVPR